MNPRRFLLWIILGSCTAPPSRSEAGPDLEVEALLESAPLEGDLGQFRVRIRNRSESYVLLRDLEGEAGAAATWQIALTGDVEYRPEPDTFVHQRKKRGPERPIFNTGLLIPGEEIAFRTRLRLLDFPRTFRFRYYRYDIHEIARNVYFEKKVDRELRYVRLVGAELESRLIRSAQPDATGHRTVVFPFAEQITSSPLEQTLDVRAEIRPRSFSLADARAKLGLMAEDEHGYYAGLALWVVRLGEQAWLVNAARTIPLPRLARLQQTFHLLDATDHPKLEVEFLKETKTLFSDDLPLISDESGRRFLAFLPRNEIVPFFEKVRDLGLVLDVELLANGGGRLIVTR